MKSISLAVILTAFVAVANGTPAVDPLIMGGLPAMLGEFPSAVFLSIPYRTLHPLCNGVIVHAQHIVTAASCLVDQNSGFVEDYQWIRIIAGDLNYQIPSADRLERHPSHAFIHPGFNPYTNENDIAVLRLTEPFPLPHNTIQPAVLRDRIVRRGAQCVYTGWGRTALGAAAAINVAQQKIYLDIYNPDLCNPANIHNGRVTESMLCTTPLTAGTISVCNGNQGGGLICNNELTGILSFGIGCGAVNNPPVFTQVRFYIDWINQQFTRVANASISVWEAESPNSRRIRV